MPDPAPPFTLALDQGSHASKALLFDAAGRVSARGEAAVRSFRPSPGRVEHDPLEILASLRGAIRMALSTEGIAASAPASSGPAARDSAAGDLAPGAFGSAGLAVQRSSVVCWDRLSGEPLSPVLSWQDRRNAAWLAAQDLDPARVRAVTGLVASPHYGASKLRWCLDHLPEVRRAADAGGLCCGPLASFLLHRLLEEQPCLVDPANAARTLLWDLRTGDWSAEMLEAFGIEREWLPRCVASRHDFGTLRLEGLQTKLAVSTGDQSAALFAGGRPDPATLFVNIGTGAFVQRVRAEAPPADTRLLRGIAWQYEDQRMFVLEGTVNGAGAALEWLAERHGVAVEALVKSLPGWLSGNIAPPLFVNGVGGLGSPFWRADCASHFSAPADLPSQAVAVLESIAFLLQLNIEAIDRAGGAGEAAATRISISGGLAGLDGLCQRLADLSGLPVERPAEREATARGVAWLLQDHRPPSAPAAAFRAGHADELRARFERWRALMEEAVGQ